MQGTKLFLPNVQQMAKIMKKPIWRNKLNFISQLSDFFFRRRLQRRRRFPGRWTAQSKSYEPFKMAAIENKRNWANIEKKVRNSLV